MPAPIVLSQVTSLTDVLQVDHFSLQIPNPPGGGDGSRLEIQNLSCSLPGLSTAVIQTRLHRHVRHDSGRQEFGSYIIPAVFVETRDRAIIQALIAMHNAKINQATGLANPQSFYKTTAYITVFDATNAPSEQRTLFNFFLESFAELPLGGEPGTVEWSAQFRYDNWQPGGI